VVSSAVVALGNVSTAVAAPPVVTIISPLNGSVSNNRTPAFSGLGEEDARAVTVDVYEGPTAGGTVIRELKTALFLAGAWFTESIEPPLDDGTYTAQATQSNFASEVGVSAPATFTVDTAAPTVALHQPESPSDNTTPSFSGAASDVTPIAVLIHAGATASGTLVSSATAAGTGAGWTSSGASPPLSVGEYTAVATQISSLPGNPTGRSAPVTFTVIPPPVITPLVIPSPPLASFNWFPPIPQTGEQVSLVSSSTDSASPITGFGWALTSAGMFQDGGSVLSTSFSTPGAHVVRLRVSNAAGLSSVATETIDVVGHATPLMQPFPVVRIAGSYDASGIKLRLLRVQQMPAGARVTVRCKGRGCPLKSSSRLAVPTKQGVAQIEFKRFERSLPAGVSLEVLVSKAGEIGKYTRLRVRRAKLPERVDMCLDPAGVKPLACPDS
jgi:Bacterial Ig-like domain